MDILNITKQSLARVLKQLVDTGYIVQQAGSSDRRERLLFPTDKGRALAERLAAPQSVRLAGAIKAVYDVLLWVTFRDVKPPEELVDASQGNR